MTQWNWRPSIWATQLQKSSVMERFGPRASIIIMALINPGQGKNKHRFFSTPLRRSSLFFFFCDFLHSHRLSLTLWFPFIFAFSDLLLVLMVARCTMQLWWRKTNYIPSFAVVPSTQPFTSKSLQTNEMRHTIQSLGLKCYC